ncbi:MAG: tetratricopeptide repeat protein [Chthoniobacterales bacterium]
MKIDRFLSELKRRNVYKVAVAYAVVGWLVMQVCSIIVPALHLHDAITTSVVVLILLGFPVALVLAWAFEITPDGIRREDEVPVNESTRRNTGRKLLVVTGVVAAIAAGLFAFQMWRQVRTPFAGVPKNEMGRLREPSLPVNEKSIAVLPFDNLSRDPDNAYFAEGVQDEILTRLAKVADLKVISRTSTQRFKSAPGDLRQIALQLGVMNILEGTVQKSNDQVRVNVQLINAMTDAHLWADIYDRKLTDMFTVESDIAKTVADTLQAKLSGSEMKEMSTRPTEDPVAHELLVKGRYFLGLRRGDNLARAIDFFQLVIARDPNYSAAYGGLSEAYIVLPRYTGADPKDVFPKAKVAAMKALELNANLPEAHNALAKLTYDNDMDFAASSREFKRAIELNPNYAGAHHWYSGGPLESLGQFDEALAQGRRAVELDPLSVVNLVDLGRIYFSARRFPEAKVEFEKALQLDPTFSYAHWHFGEMLQVSGDTKRAAAEYDEAAKENDHPEPIALRGQLSARMGRPQDGRKALQDLDELRKHRPVAAYWFALVHLSLGDKQEALRFLEQSFANREGYNIGPIKVDPMLDALRGEPRFEALVQKVIGPKIAPKP